MLEPIFTVIPYPHTGIVTGSKLNLVVVKKSTTAATAGGESSTKSAPKYTPDDFWVALEKVRSYHGTLPTVIGRDIIKQGGLKFP